MTRDPLVSLVAEVGGRLVAWFGWARRRRNRYTGPPWVQVFGTVKISGPQT